ncbi:MAG: DUF4058 family protein [Planctomycetes bacterium]|nr:DUF4058 family protein [Planctomycetota bacterium]
MPVHDWTRVDAGVFHDFHNVWIALLRIALNSGLLPKGYYAMSEQHGGKYLGDVLTLHHPPTEPRPRVMSGGVAVAEAPPKVSHKSSLAPTARLLRKTLTIRHASGHRIVAMLEIVSAANKDRKEHLDQFLRKMEDALANGIHLLIVDLFPPSKRDPLGLHAALWERLGDEADGAPSPSGKPLTLASYLADSPPTAYWEYISVGDVLPDMPLFLDPDFYVKAPLESTYMTAWESTPEPYRAVLENPRAPARRKRGR